MKLAGIAQPRRSGADQPHVGSDGSHRDDDGTRSHLSSGGAATGFVARLLANVALGLELQRAHRTQLNRA